MARFIYTYLISLLLLLPIGSSAQSPYDDEVCLDKTVKQLKREEQKKKLMKGLDKTLIYISYLSYKDRTVDRPLTGIAEFEPYGGMIIRNIDIKVIDPYGVTIEKPTNDHYNKFQKFANRIQIKTKDWVVRNDLLFKHGERVVPVLFADTEKNLWGRNTFKDVKIFMRPVDGSEELVDVVVMVQDMWSWSLNTSLEYNKIAVGIQFNNFLGMPQSISNWVSLNYRKDNLYSVYGKYSYDNIKSSHIDARVSYEYSNFTKGGAIRIRRDFFSANSRWAGHIKAGLYKENNAVPNAFGPSIPTNVFYNWQDVWLATSHKLPGRLGKKYDLLRFILSARMYRSNYTSRPFKRSQDGAQTFIDRTCFLGSMGFANWNYYVDHSVFYLGQAEYFSRGLNGALILGFDYDEELQKRFYAGLQLEYGKYIGRAGYYNARASYGGFVKKDSYQQILFRIKQTFYTSAIKLGPRFMMRQFISVDVNLGFNRPLGKELVLNNASGMRGIFTNYIRGTRNYIFNFETDVYPTFKILGFTSSAFAFANLAISQKGSMNEFQLKQAYGAGIRLRNLGLGIGSFEIMFAYYPGLNVPNLKPWTVAGGFDNTRAITPENLFLPTILNTEGQPLLSE
ncbi:MAG TPA: hypothetical protein VK154_12695 [Chitinophagales bacterium]|nr:hypothetical protein [Chitinophagales bacterium]